jgi:site-specific DNA recombinase
MRNCLTCQSTKLANVVGLASMAIRTKVNRSKTGTQFGGEMWSARRVYDTLVDQKYIGRIVHKEVSYPGEHQAIVSEDVLKQVQVILK